MIYCSVKYCCSNSSIPGVILHSIREEWLNLVDWKRPNPNVICNEHFPSYIKVNGKKLSKSAVPSIFNIIGAVQNCSLETVLNEYNYAVPAIQKLKKMYDGNTSKGKKFQNQSYSLKAQKRKLDEKIRSLESVIVEIKDKFSLPEETINLLHSSASKILEELFQRVIKKLKYSDCRDKYLPALRSFA